MNSLIEKIATDLCLDTQYVNRIVNRSDYYYRDYSIPKHDGSSRAISQASAELKTLQYWVVQNVLPLLPVSNATAAYKPGDSIKKHAMRHVNSCHILHTDIKNFFPSIHFSHLKGLLDCKKEILSEHGFIFEDTYETLSKICFRHDQLCIGTVSSPMISNIVLFNFDEHMLDLIKNSKMVYSRYADDIYISSGQYIATEYLSLIKTELKQLGFNNNITKTSYHSKKNRCMITGLIITNDGNISVGLDMKKQIKKMLYQKLKHGIGESSTILGYLAFLKDVEPSTYNNLIAKYSTYCGGDIILALKAASQQ